MVQVLVVRRFWFIGLGIGGIVNTPTFGDTSGC